MTDKFDILIFINERTKPKSEYNKDIDDYTVTYMPATWNDLLYYFVEGAPPHRRISKRTLHLSLLELIKAGYVEKTIDKKTLKPCYLPTAEGERIAERKKVEREWIEAVKKATEQILVKYIEENQDFIALQSDIIKDSAEAYSKILQDIFNLTKEEIELAEQVYICLRPGLIPGPSIPEGFYFWLKNKEYRLLKDEDLAFLSDEEKAKLKQIFAKLASAKKP
jgi:hypothetical protein